MFSWASRRPSTCPCALCSREDRTELCYSTRVCSAELQVSQFKFFLVENLYVVFTDSDRCICFIAFPFAFQIFLLGLQSFSCFLELQVFDDAVTVIFLFEISLKACNESSKEAWFVFFLFVFGADCYDEFAQIFIQLLWRDLFKFSFLVFRCYRGPVAQLVEQRFALREVVSSTLAGPTLRVLK